MMHSYIYHGVRTTSLIAVATILSELQHQPCGVSHNSGESDKKQELQHQRGQSHRNGELQQWW